MGDSISAIYDDIEEYQDLCEIYKEPVQKSSDGYPDCYGNHAHKLKAKARKEYEEKRKREESGAIFSDNGLYRYRLWRKFGWGPTITFIMLNPSTADAETNDPTVERCLRRAKEYNFGKMEIVNIFALRSTDPKVLYNTPDPIGPKNNTSILEACVPSSVVVCAWGTHGSLNGRGEFVKNLLQCNGKPLHFLRLTSKGIPGHPLYVPYSIHPQLWA